MSHFAFLVAEWPGIADSAMKAESLLHTDPRAACFYARRTLELVMHWVYKHDSALKFPYQDRLSALIHEPTFRNTAGQPIFLKAQLITKLGNEAVHSPSPIDEQQALIAVRELFHVTYWLARTYARGTKPAATLTFNPDNLPKPVHETPQSREQLAQLEAKLKESDEKLTELLADKAALDEELARLRGEVAKVKKLNAAQADTHDYSESETRDYFIDLLLREAGWPLNQPQDREYEVSGMPNAQGKGYVDYVLWGADGRPLAVVEAKRAKVDPRVGQQQAKLYADALEAQFGWRPVIYYSNGYEHWLWDDAFYPPRPVQGFYTQDELELLMQRRASRKPLATATVNDQIAGRYYQTRAIRRIGEAFEQDKDRKALLVMATGSGKTRTVVALADLLMRCNWVKRVLFLADRVALVNQTVNAFKQHLPEAAPVNLVTDKYADGRVYVSTYPTIMNLINEMNNDRRRFGVGYFDLVIIDEAHRSVFQKYRAIFDYFDSLLVGLTATPKDEIDRNTYRLFELENGVPTDLYPFEDAVKDKFLVPFEAVSVPLRFQREGIKYEDLSEEEKDQWDALEWDEEGGVPDSVDPASVNKWLFNIDTVDKVLAHLMTRGIKVAGGDQLGKTIIFAKNSDHAQFIADRFNANYPHYKGEFARVIDYKTKYAQTLLDDFSDPTKPPHIAISVDMLDTGIDVPEVVNLVFFKIVRSKTKFWQMIGRGTRKRPDLFGPSQDKQFFYVFDYCQNLEYFSQNAALTDGAAGEALGTRLFKARLELIQYLDKLTGAPDESALEETAALIPGTLAWVREETAELLCTEVGAMNPDNFVVRPKRRLVEKYSQPGVWAQLSLEDLVELTHEVAGLPAGLEPESEEAKRFDLLLLNLQLARLQGTPGFERLSNQVRAIMGLLEEKAAIPMVHEQMDLILALQTDEWWQDVTVPMLEQARRHLRNLVQFIEKRQRKPIYTDFADEMGPESTVEFVTLGGAQDFERFRAKARQFLRDNEQHLTIHKLRWNKALTAVDLEELERMLVGAGVGTEEDLSRAKTELGGIGLFIRSLVGLDREAAMRAFGDFLNNTAATANQIEFVSLIIDHLTEHGVMEPERLYESPFTDLSPSGPEELFSGEQVDYLIAVLEEVRRRAAS